MLIMVLTVGYLTAHFLMDTLKNRYLLAGGLEYMLLGVMMGPVAAGGYNEIITWAGHTPDAPVELITDSVLQSMAPAITLGIGSIGLLAGLRLKFDTSTFRSDQIQASILINLVTGLMLGVPALIGMVWYVSGSAAFATTTPFFDNPMATLNELAASFSRAPIGELMPLTLLIVATGVVSATRPIEYTIERHGSSGPLGRFAINAAELSGVFGILIFGVLFGVGHPEQSSFRQLTSVEWLVIEVAVGALFGLLFSLFIDRDDESEKLLVALLGIIVFATGVAYFLKLSPIFINFFLGLTLANTSRFSERLLEKLTQIEKPFYIVLYFFAGVAWRPAGTWWMMLGLVALYFALRWSGRKLGSEVAFRAVDNPTTPGLRGLGSGLFAQGGLSVAMVLNFALAYAAPRGGTWVYAYAMEPDMPAVKAMLKQGVALSEHNLTALVSTIILANILISELLAFRLTRNLLIDANELEPTVKLVPEDMYAHYERPSES
ncbi:MAG: hypothetical protein CMH57_03630 [Myxococcales bacterium]|nr:hypothetical protein [Myxococcales bacterium]